MAARSSDRDDASHVARKLFRKTKRYSTTHQSGRSTHLMSIDHDSWKSGRFGKHGLTIRGGSVLGQRCATCRQRCHSAESNHTRHNQSL